MQQKSETPLVDSGASRNSSTRLDDIARAMGGEVRGDHACFPTPGHSKRDRGSTAALSPGAPDGVLICSYNGGDPLEIKDKLRDAGVLPKRQSWKCAGKYEFRDEAGVLLYTIDRLEHPTEGKRFVPKRPDGTSGIKGIRRVLYRLPDLIAADPAEIVYLPEGERKADKLASWGLVATAFGFGAKGWRKEYALHLAGRAVVLLPDNDDEGRGMAQRAARDIEAAGGTARIVELPGLPSKGDIVDWSGTREELKALAASAFEAGGVEKVGTTRAPAMAKVKKPAKRARPQAEQNGCELLNSIAAFLGKFIAYPSEHCSVAHVLWIAHAHLMDAWESTPRLAFLSPEPASGKSRCLELTELLVPRPVEAVNVTPAYLFRKVADEAGPPTILFDEIDTVFGPRAKDNEELRGLLNAGHRRGAVAGRCVVRGKEVFTEELPAYCAVALAGLGGLPDTILTRSIIIRMRRRTPEEVVVPFRRREHGPEGHELRDGLASWAKAMEPRVTGAWPAMPAGIVDRDADVWEPLLAIADAAGGEWPDRARCSAVALVAASKESTPSLGVKLLTDLRVVFGKKDFLATAHILQELVNMDESPWGDLKGKALDARGLARRLAPYGVKPGNLRVEGAVAKGYKSEDLLDAWQRYLSPLPSPARESATSATSATDDAPCPRCNGEACDWCEAGR